MCTNDNTDGALTPMTTAKVPAGTYPISITVDPTGRFAYVANNQSANISQYTIGTDGSLGRPKLCAR